MSSEKPKVLVVLTSHAPGWYLVRLLSLVEVLPYDKLLFIALD